MTPAIPAASASAAPRRAGKGAAPATPAWSAQPPSRTAAHANTAFAGAPRIPRPPSPQAARAPALFAPSPPLAHAAQTVPQPQAIPTQTHPIHRSSIKVGNDARTLKGVPLRPNTVHFGPPWGVTCLPDNAGWQQWPVFLPAFRPASV